MANTRPRSVVISTNTGKIFRSRIIGNMRAPAVVCALQVSAGRNRRTSQYFNRRKNPSPGTVLQAQVPEQKRKIKLDKEKPVIEDLTDRKPVRPAESIESRADIRDRSLVKTAAFTTGQMKTNRLSAFSLKRPQRQSLPLYCVFA